MAASSNVFRSFIEEQLSSIPDVYFRRMFGGYGIYSGVLFFGILHKERLYFRISDATRNQYEEKGMSCFITPGKKKALKNYHEVPLDIIEDRLELVDWARKSIKASANP